MKKEEFTIGFEFEFLTKIKKTEDVLASLQKSLKKKIEYPLEIVGFDEYKIPNHSALTTTANLFKLERDFSGGVDMYELITGPQKFTDAIVTLDIFLDWLKVNGYTNEKTSIHINLGLIHQDILKSAKRYEMRNLDILKFCLLIDEELIYKNFPNRRNNVYARSVKEIRPLSPFYTRDSGFLNKNNFRLPDSKYFGVNFLKLQKNYLEFRYLGGDEYEKKGFEIKECINHFISVITETLQNPDLNKVDRVNLRKYTKKYFAVTESLFDYRLFKKNYPNIEILVDLKNDENLAKLYFDNVFKEKIYYFIIFSDLTKGTLNYDSDRGKMQIHQAKLKNLYNFDSYDFSECEISGGIITNSVFYDCKIDSTIIKNSEFLSKNKISNSKLEDLLCIDVDNEFNGIYVENNTKTINGTFNKCIFRNIVPEKKSKLKDCLMIKKDLEKLTNEMI